MFNTHLGRYRFLWVPFGLKMSQDIFQMQMDDIVAQCPGVLAIHDDIFIYGSDDRDHNANIINLFNVAQKEGLVFNSAKCAIKQDCITFFGSVFSAKGYSPDPSKNTRHHRDDTPSDKIRATIIPRSSKLSTDVCTPSQSPHGTVTNNPEKGEHLHLGWECQQQFSENQIPAGKVITKTPQILWQEQTHHSTMCNASLKGLGACIIQEGQAISIHEQIVWQIWKLVMPTLEESS